MSTFQKKCKNIHFSVSYDGVTIYPQFTTTKIIKIAEECRDIDGCDEIKITTQKGKIYYDCQKAIIKNLQSERNVRFNDPDHLLYHQDNYNSDSTHAHLKFSDLLTKEQLTNILNIVMNHGLINKKEKKEFLSAYKARIKSACTDFTKHLTHDQTPDTKKIIDQIKQCRDNDILVHLHTYLLKNKYAYLRLIDSESDIQWQGTNKQGHVIETSKAWASIEKAFAFQMANNIRAGVKQFTTAVTLERSTQLSHHQFFGIKRKMHASGASKLLTSFSNADEVDFDKRYKKIDMNF